MLRFVVFIFLLTVIAAKPALESIQNEEHPNAIQELEALDRVLRKFIERLTAIQELAASKSKELQQSLATSSSECSIKHARDVEINGELLMATYYNCSVFGILEDFATLGIDSAKYVYSTYKDTSVIIADILVCTSAGFNPFTFVYCIFKAASVIPSEIRDIISQTKGYASTLSYLVPQIDHEIEACFHRSSSFYDKYVNDVIEKVKLCDSSKNI